jgi:hypothetical protein
MLSVIISKKLGNYYEYYIIPMGTQKEGVHRHAIGDTCAL